MIGKLQLAIKQDQRIGLSQQLRQAISLLQYGTLDLKQVVTDLLNENPLLEYDEDSLESKPSAQTVDPPDHYIQSIVNHRRNEFSDDKSWENVAINKSLQDHLREQSEGSIQSPDEHFISETLIEAIDDYGRIIMPLEEIQEILSQKITVTLEKIEKVLRIIQGFEPVGVGHRNLQECLLLQLNAHVIQDRICHLAKIIIADYFEYVANFKKLHSMLKISQDDYARAMNLIRTLNPKPGLNYGQEDNRIAEPELIVKKIGKKWQVYLIKGLLTHIQVNSFYKDIIKKNVTKSNSELHKKVEEAQQLISGLKRRNQTLLQVAQCIVDAQHDFFELGPSALRPMNINAVAQTLEVHESTVSRLTHEKYLATPRGVFELKYFFPSAVNNILGEGNSSTSIKESIKDIISKETPGECISDGAIVKELSLKGIKIARRTVAKYREALKISACHLRNCKTIGR